VLSAYENDSPGLSDFYRVNESNKKVLVFVHGVIGSAQETWSNQKQHTYWPEIVADDERFDEYDIFIVSYYTPFTQLSPNIYQLANELNTILFDNGIYTQPETIESSYDEVVFVGHSMGNLVIRTSMIVSPEDTHKQMIPLILSIAAPSMGSNAAEFIDTFSDNPSFNDMAKVQQNSFLSLMNKTWLAKRFDTEIACAYEKQATKGIKIVEKYSAIEVCTRPVDDKCGINADHENIVKPSSQSSAIHKWLWRELSAHRNKKGWELERWSEEIILAGKDYLESNIHMAMMALVIEEEFNKHEEIKVKVTRKYEAGNGMRLQSELKNENIDMYAEYSGSLLFAYLGVDPVNLSNEFKNDRSKIESFHTLHHLNKELRNADFNMEFYPQFGFNSPFKLVMLKHQADEMGLLKNGRVKMSEFAVKSSVFELGGGTGYFYRSDGFQGLNRFYKNYNMNFSNTRYIKHIRVYEELLKSKSSATPLTIIGYATDHELTEDSRFVVIEDDKGFNLIHRPGPLAHRFLGVKFPEIRAALSKLEGIVNETEMISLLKEGNKIWNDKTLSRDVNKKGARIEAMVKVYLQKKGVLSGGVIKI
jgi:glycine betaine/choline ABC-type transport system substrate-binding protein